ncbi:MAG: hypothetical protein IPO85_04340 [Saprospiraceae bacterium]|uniref:Polysaccharide deacetylase n=1 Tax=Candidatus Defluviibacterium haderslevense TaxID=2981993 RepID=A0A9D7XCG4_9BACT|nr:hypothetical protein [Candidatus Defluviibacterium haderslevense]
MQTNSKLYNFSDFTRKNYRELLRFAKKNHNFVSFTEFDPNSTDILWRHDVDFSMHAARKLAIIEESEGVKSTFFILLHSEFYNLFEIEIHNLVKDIISLGHDIGLHFYSKYYNIINEVELIKKLNLEKEFIQDIFNCEIKVFSFHNPEIFDLNCEKDVYANMINTYSYNFKNEIAYCSDSNGYWRHQRLEDFLKANLIKPIQVLTHPEWWSEIEMSPKEKVLRCIDERSKKVYSDYELILKKHNRQNIDWL